MIGLKSLLGCFLFLSLAVSQAGTQSFSVSSTQAYASVTITFDASGINQAKKFLWTFGDGGTLTTTNPVANYQYKTAGKFTASLSYQVNASDKNPNYKDAGSIAITILAKQQQNLPPTASLSCTVNNLLVNCNALGSADPQNKPLSFVFSYGDNFSESNTTGLSSHAFSVAGLYSVTLTVTNSSGLSSHTTTQVQVVRPPNVLPSLVLNCTSDVINTLLCNANGSTDSDGNIVSYKYSWDDNSNDMKADSANITHVFSTSGSHSVTLTAIDNDGGVSTFVKSFTVKANTLPVANFSCDASKPQKLTCSSSSTDADVGDSIQSYSWKFGNASAFSTTTSNTDYDFKTGGSFDVTLSVTDSYGGVGSLTKTIVVKNNTPPMANFSCTNTGLRTIHCENSSSDNDGSIVNISWVLDDGTNLTGTNFDHTFSDDQTHTITLSVTDDLGATASLAQTVQPIKNQAPQLDINANTLTGFAPLAINFTANAVDSDGIVSNLNWNFSDGGSDSGTSVSHTFSAAGTYTITAIATDNFGATTTKSLSVTVNAPLIKTPPNAFFKVFEFDTWVELHSTLTKAQYDIERAYYTIDGVNTVEVTEFYPNTINWIDLKTFGWHEIKLTIVDIYGQQSTFTQQVNQVEDLDTLAPFVDFKVQQSAARTVFLNFNRSFDYDIDQGIQSFHVDYGNGESEDTTNLYLTHVYSAAGTYSITVTAYTIHGTQNTTNKQFTVSDSAPATILPPMVNFGYRIYDFAQNVSFYNDKSGTPNGTILSYVWDFGDGQTATGQKVAHFYDPGSYFVTLTIVDSSGQSSSQTQHITIFGSGTNLVAQLGCDIAKPYFDYTQTCQVFALDKQNQITRVRVNWGDGTANNLTLPSVNGIFRPTHKYASAGTYTVTETVTTSRGETTTATTTLPLTKYNPVIANVQCYTNNLLVSCNALGSYDMTGQPLTYTFDYGDSYTETNTNGLSSHTYSSAGLYTVNISVKNTSGDIATAQTQVMPVAPVHNPPIASGYCNSYGPQSISCFSTSVDTNGQNSLLTEWSVEDKIGMGDLFTVTLSSSGVKTVILKVTNSYGDVSTLAFNVTAPENQAPIANADCSLTSDSKNILCKTLSYDSDGSITKTQWTLSNGKTFTGTSFALALNGETSLGITLEVTDNLGKTSSYNKNIDFIASPPASIDSIADQCSIPDALKSKLCSDEYFSANSINDLNDYLANGKLKDGKLLNLEISNEINSDVIAVGTPCQLKVNSSIQANKICLRGSSVVLSHALLNANKGNIDIVADNNISIDSSNIKTEGNTSLFTKYFQPFDGKVELINGSIVDSNSIQIDTKSSILKDQNSTFLSGAIVLNGGNCEVAESDFVGTCLNNTISKDISIDFTSSSSDKQLIGFEVTGINDSSEKVFWRFNKGAQEPGEDNSFNKKFPLPGNSLVEVAVVDTQGFFRVSNKLISVEPSKTYPGQILVFNFYGNDDLNVNAFLADQTITLYKDPNVAQTYLLQVPAEAIDDLNLVIPSFNYNSVIHITRLDTIDNPDDFINGKLDEIINTINSMPVTSFNSSLLSAINSLKLQINSFNNDDKIKMAQFLLANTSQNLNVVVNLKNKSKFNILDIFLPKAFAINFAIWNDIPQPFKEFLLANFSIVIGSASAVLSVAGFSLVKLKACEWCAPISAGLGLIAVGTLLKAAFGAQDQLSTAYLPDPDSFFGALKGRAVSNAITSVQFRSQFVSVDSITNNSPLVKETKDGVEAINSYLRAADKNIVLVNDIMSVFNVSGLEPFQKLQFPQTGFPGFLNPNLISSPQVISPTDGSAFVSSFTPNGNNLDLKIISTRSQAITVRFNYKNSDFGIEKQIDVDMYITGLSSLTWSYQISVSGRQAKLWLVDIPVDNTSFIYEWDFGDGETETSIEPVIIHRYPNEGQYTPKVKIYDDKLNFLVSSVSNYAIPIKDQSHISVCTSFDKVGILNGYITPTTVLGFSGQILENELTAGFGTCYVKGTATYSGPDSYCLSLYNCAFDDLKEE